MYGQRRCTSGARQRAARGKATAMHLAFPLVTLGALVLSCAFQSRVILLLAPSLALSLRVLSLALSLNSRSRSFSPRSRPRSLSLNSRSRSLPPHSRPRFLPPWRAGASRQEARARPPPAQATIDSNAHESTRTSSITRGHARCMGARDKPRVVKSCVPQEHTKSHRCVFCMLLEDQIAARTWLFPPVVHSNSNIMPQEIASSSFHLVCFGATRQAARAHSPPGRIRVISVAISWEAEQV